MIKSYPKHPRKEDKKYLAFIRHEPCLVCAKGYYVPSHYPDRIFIRDAHHPKSTKFGGNLGWNVKADDRNAMPLCRGHHSESESLGEERFYRKYSIEPHKEIKRLNKKYKEL
jgi:hypothetical protein